VTLHALLVALARLGLAALALAAAAAIIGLGPAVRQLALGAALLALALFFGRRHRALEDAAATAPDLPPHATDAGLSRAVVASLFPSSVGVAILAAGSVFLDARLTAILAGMLAAMGFASLVFAGRSAWWEHEHSVRLVATPGLGALYVRKA
jgi:hypothetical protein